MVRGKTTVPGYWKNEQATKELYTRDWLHTGDLGRFDEKGFLYIVDRKKDMIKTGAENVYSKEVEDVLCTHPSIADVAVIGLKDPNPSGWGEVVTAIIVPKAGMVELTVDVTAESLEQHTSVHGPHAALTGRPAFTIPALMSATVQWPS